MQKVVIFGLFFLIIDQLLKYLILSNFDVNGEIVLISSFFSILYVQNYGAAFSFFQNWNYFLIIASLLGVGFVYFYFLKNDVFLKKYPLVIGALLGGIIGNLIDRVIHGYVIDFFAFEFFGWPFPIFNFADMLIVGAVIYIIIFVDWSLFDEISDK